MPSPETRKEIKDSNNTHSLSIKAAAWSGKESILTDFEF